MPQETIVLDGVYTLRHRIGDGGMATVYLADVDLDHFDYTLLYAFTQVQGASQAERRTKAEAISRELADKDLDTNTVRSILEAHKIPLPAGTAAIKIAKEDMDRQRFEAEWQNLLSLNHENVVKVYGGGEVDGSPYYAMELLQNIVDGDELFNTFSVEQKVDVILQAGRGLAYLHANGIVHRDVKPDNMVTCRMADGRYVTKITDLGIAKNLDAGMGLTMTNTVLGTPYYMSPEQVASSKNVKPQTDIYSLGASLYRLLAGVPPYQDKATVIEIVHALSQGEPPTALRHYVQDLPDALAEIVHCAMAFSTESRYETMNDLVHDLELFLVKDNADHLGHTVVTTVHLETDSESVQNTAYAFEDITRRARARSGPFSFLHSKRFKAARGTLASIGSRATTALAKTGILTQPATESSGATTIEADGTQFYERRNVMAGAGIVLAGLFLLIIIVGALIPSEEESDVPPAATPETTESPHTASVEIPQPDPSELVSPEPVARSERIPPPDLPPVPDPPPVDETRNRDEEIRREAERLAAERIAKAKREADIAAALREAEMRAEAERLAKAKLEAERKAAAEREARIRAEAERRETEERARKQAEADRLAAERARREAEAMAAAREQQPPTQPPVPPVIRTKTYRSIPAANEMFERAQHEREIGIRSIISKKTQYEKAMTLYQGVIDKYPGSDKVEACYYYKGLIQQTLMNYDEALKEYKRLLTINRDTDFDVYYYIAEIYDRRLSKGTEAKKWYRLATQKSPEPDNRIKAARRYDELTKDGF